MRATATLLVTVAMALAAIGLAVAAPGGAPARAELRAASGAAHISNSRAGQALVSAAGVRPGESSSGTVTIGNDGDARGRFALAGTGVQDTPGLYGGLLSQRVVLVVEDVTGPPKTVFEGAPGALGEVDLGSFAPGDERDYRVTLALPDGGAGDNAVQGAALTVGLVWRATTTPAATPTPAPDPPAPTPPAPPTVPATPVSLPDAIGLPAAKSCVKRGRLTLRLKAPNGSRVAAATVTVNGRVKARLKGAKARRAVKLRGLRRRTKLKVSLKTGDGRRYTASRTYRACAKR